MPKDYSRFQIQHYPEGWSFLDTLSGWTWDHIKEESSVFRMMDYLLTLDLEFKDHEYKRLRKLDGDEWEREITKALGE